MKSRLTIDPCISPVHSLAHNFKAVVGIFAARKAVQAPRELERMGNSGQFESANEHLGILYDEVSVVLEELANYQEQARALKG